MYQNSLMILVRLGLLLSETYVSTNIHKYWNEINKKRIRLERFLCQKSKKILMKFGVLGFR